MYNLKMLIQNMDDFESRIEYKYNVRDNAILALTHSSYANENKSGKMVSNERLEFLGDAILNVVISEEIYSRYLSLTEGEMTKLRASIVCESSLVKCANKIGLGGYLLLGKGEELTGGRSRSSILSDAFEAVIGSIYIDGGMDSAKSFIYNHMTQVIGDSVKGVTFTDYKTQLQETFQKSSDCRIAYEVIEERGPDHNKAFVMQVKINDKVMGTGEGKSKKEAEQNAAKAAMEKKTSRTRG